MSSLRIVVWSTWIVLVLVSGIWTASAVSIEPPIAVSEPDTSSVSDVEVAPEAWSEPGGARTAAEAVRETPRTAVQAVRETPRTAVEAVRETGRRVDLYGNEVEDAVTEYRIDPRGDLYERHAPQTALPEPKRPDA